MPVLRKIMLKQKTSAARIDSEGNMRKLFQLPILLIAASLAGCAQSVGLGNFSLLSDEPAAETAPAAEGQIVALAPGEIPPVPARRPGKRPRGAQLAAAKAAQLPEAEAAPASEATQPAKPEGSGSGFSLASLGEAFKAKEGEGPDSILVDQPPIEAYSLIAARIKYCWLNPSTPRLPNHGFHAEIAPGEAQEAKIIVYQKAEDGRRGTSVVKVNISAESSGSLISTQNSRLDAANTAAFKADLARWAKGDDRCKA
jgi:hypothetical protein